MEIINNNVKNKYGQYFTTNIELKNKISEFILNNPLCILEPCVGQGDLIEEIYLKNKEIKFDIYEIDKNIKLLKSIENLKIIHEDFLKAEINKKYKTIIGNPPFIRIKDGNIYINFIKKCYNLLELNGEIIFIVPSDFYKLTSASKLLNKMMENGTFTHIYHPHNEKLFENANIDIILFRYCKNNKLKKTVLYNNEILNILNNNGLILFNKDKDNNSILVKDYFNVYVGLVSGKERVFKNNKLGNINILTKENKFDKYIFINEYPCENDEINKYLYLYKEELINRKIKKFNEDNWFKFGAPRNIEIIKNNIDKECIYIYNLTRNVKIAFKSKVSYFGSSLILLIPIKECNLDKIVSYLNSELFKNNFIFSGRFKIGHRQISYSNIPKNYLN